MARSTGNEGQRLLASAEAGLPELLEITVSDAASGSDSGALFATPNPGHGGLRNECWSRPNGGFCPGGHGDTAGLQATQRLQRPSRNRTASSRMRPSRAAGARFVSTDREFLEF